MRYFVLLVIALILGSLASALFYMLRPKRDAADATRMVRALSWRVGLSVGLFLLLIGGRYFGFIPGRL